MKKIVLIHGYATGLEVQPVRERHGEDAGFLAFRDEVQRGNAVSFRWSLRRDVTFPTAASVKPYRSLYQEERARTKDPEVHAELVRFLDQEQPVTILCHSLGSVLFWEFLKTHRLPDSVKNVVFVQADLPTHPDPLPREVELLLHAGSPQLHNLCCPWDPTLLLSSAIHQEVRAGLTGLELPYARNQRFPLWRPWNLHTSSIRDPKLVEWVANL